MPTESRIAPDAALAELVARFLTTECSLEIEMIAARLAETGDHGAVAALLARIGERDVQSDAHVERAVCEALVALDVMVRVPDECFVVKSRLDLEPDVAALVNELDPPLPLRYLIRRVA